MSFDNDFVASGSVLLPDPPDVQRGGEMPLETLGKMSTSFSRYCRDCTQKMTFLRGRTPTECSKI